MNTLEEDCNNITEIIVDDDQDTQDDLDDIEFEEKASFEHVTKDCVVDLYGIIKCINGIMKDIVTNEVRSRQEFMSKLKNLMKLVEKSSDNSLEGKNGIDKSVAIYEFTKVLDKAPPFYSEIIIDSLYLKAFSSFDKFMGDFLTTVFTLKPELIYSSEKKITVMDVLSCSSIDEFKSILVEKEIDSIRRESYVEQIELLEKKFDLPLKKFDNWPKFVEITQRRNIIMHCGGIASDQYVKICKEHKCDNLSSKGDKVSINLEYLRDSIFILLEVAIKLIQVTWRKLFSDENKDADQVLNSVIFDMLQDKEFDFAIVLGNYAKSIKKPSDQISSLMFLINLCIALKSKKEDEKVVKYLDEVDWSSLMLEFKFAKDILVDRHDLIKETMIKIGPSSKTFTKHSYAFWPIFSFVRDNEDFKEGFYCVFNEKLEDYLELYAYEIAEEKVNSADFEVDLETIEDEPQIVL